MSMQCREGEQWARACWKILSVLTEIKNIKRTSTTGQLLAFSLCEAEGIQGRDWKFPITEEELITYRESLCEKEEQK